MRSTIYLYLILIFFLSCTVESNETSEKKPSLHETINWIELEAEKYIGGKIPAIHTNREFDQITHYKFKIIDSTIFNIKETFRWYKDHRFNKDGFSEIFEMNVKFNAKKIRSVIAEKKWKNDNNKGENFYVIEIICEDGGIQFGEDEGPFINVYDLKSISSFKNVKRVQKAILRLCELNGNKIRHSENTF